MESVTVLIEMMQLHFPLKKIFQLHLNLLTQVVTKRCRLSCLTNIAPSLGAQMWGEEGSCGVSADEYSCAHHVTWSPNKLWRSTSIFNLCINCAADFSLLNLPKGKSLGRSKPATNS
jgi:hypothetical protein